jgi:Protein of unknown function (DUF2845)
MRTKVSCCLAAAVVLLGAAPARGSVLCGRSQVLPGATQAEVLDKCGAPSRRQSLSGKAPAARSSGKKSAGGREVWVYDLGSRQLVRYLTFEHGRLRAIDFGGYGR